MPSLFQGNEWDLIGRPTPSLWQVNSPYKNAIVESATPDPDDPNPSQRP